MSEFQRVILVHYHEIGLKGHNRSAFEKRLQRNLEALLRGHPLAAVHRVAGRIVAFLREGTPKQQALDCAGLAARVPGVARVSTGYKAPRELERMEEAARRALEDAQPFETFKVQARRAHTDFPTSSMEMNKLVGSALCEAFPDKKVRMKGPDVQVGVEVVQNAAYVYAFSVRGVGGLPVGSSGKVCCLLSSGIDSPVATWRMARRGARCIGVHFSGRPETSDASEFLVRDIGAVLDQTGCISKIYTVPLGSHQREISLYAPPPLRVILYRRLMMKVAERVAHAEHAGALVTGESLGQVASQTLDNIRCTDEAVSLPVFRPLIGTDKQEIIEEAHALGTFDISTQDAPDCCTLFMPRSPETHAKLPQVLEAESRFPVEDWVEELAASAEVFSYSG